VLRIILDATHVRYDRKRSLDTLVGALQQATPLAAGPAEEGIRIVSLADRNTLREINENHLDQLERHFGCRVTLDHICLPPTAIVLSDLIFHDYFQPRLEQTPFAAVDRALTKLKQASLVIADDTAELLFLYESTYAALSHNLARDPRADLISFRWQDYTREHDKLPLTVVGGLDVPLDTTNRTLADLGRYLDVPVFRIANIPGFTSITEDWEYRPLRDTAEAGPEPEALLGRLTEWLEALGRPLTRRRPRPGPRLVMSEPLHFCSHKLRQEPVDKVLAKYDSFCLAGQSSSAPYVRRELARLGKRYVEVPSHGSKILESLPEQYDCLLICGSMGDVVTDMPVVALQHVGGGWRTRGLGVFADELGPLEEISESGADWFYAFEFNRGADLQTWQEARLAWQEARLTQQEVRQEQQKVRQAQQEARLAQRETRLAQQEARRTRLRARAAGAPGTVRNPGDLGGGGRLGTRAAIDTWNGQPPEQQQPGAVTPAYRAEGFPRSVLENDAMLFHDYEDAIQVIRVTRDPTGKAQRTPLGCIPKETLAPDGTLLKATTSEEQAEIQEWLERQHRIEHLLDEAAAFGLLRSVRASIEYARKTGDAEQREALITLMESSVHELRRGLMVLQKRSATKEVTD
jgi:hypothetical protein